MAKRVMMVMVVLAAVVTASVAMAAPTAEYVGTFQLYSGWYRSGVAFVPTAMNDARGGVLTGTPTLLTWAYGNGADENLKEWYLPSDASLALTSGDTPPAATQVATADGGTYVQEGDKVHISWPSAITLMGNGTVYGMYGNRVAEGFGGEVPLGTVEDWDVDPVSVVDQFPTRPTAAGAATSHWVERGGLAAVAGTTDTLVSVAYSSSGTAVVVGTHVKGAPDSDGFAWTTTSQFYFHTASTSNSRWAIEYVQFGGEDYYVMYDGVVGHAGGAELMFFDASVFNNDGSGAVDADALGGPTFTISLNDKIGAGWGWNDDGTTVTTNITDMAYDAATGRLYLIEEHPNGARVPGRDAPIHVLQLTVPPVAEPAGLSLLGLGLLVTRRKRS